MTYGDAGSSFARICHNLKLQDAMREPYSSRHPVGAVLQRLGSWTLATNGLVRSN